MTASAVPGPRALDPSAIRVLNDMVGGDPIVLAEIVDAVLDEAPPVEQRPWIVAMTANAMDGDRERCIEAGMNGYISKPIRAHELVDAIITAPPAGE